MINRRGGATTSLILGIAGVIGVGVAGGMALTGTTPCSILSACGIKPAAKVETVAMTGDASSCPVTGAKATTVANASDSGCCPSDKAIDAAPVAQTVALATESCSTEAKAACADAAASACSAPKADGVEVKVVTASQTAAKGEVCAMAASCAPANCTDAMMKACTDSGKICPQDKSATPAAQTVALADCSNVPECAVDDGVACSTKGADCHKVQPAAQPAAQTVVTEAAAGSCCPSTGKAGLIAAASKTGADVFVAPDAMRPLYTLQFTGKGMPMLIPAAMFNASACDTKDAGSCGGEAKSACSEEKKAECGTTDCATATTAALR
jgi:hypothetical protein